MSDRSSRADFTARYLVESAEPLAGVAEVIAGEQSSGTFLALPGETAELKERSRARVTSITMHEPSQSIGQLDRGGDARRGAHLTSFPAEGGLERGDPGAESGGCRPGIPAQDM